MAKKYTPQPTGLTVVEMPMAGLPRLSIEGGLEQMRHTLSVAERTVRGEITGELKDGVDAVQLLVDQAKLIGQAELVLRLDDEARERNG